MGKRNRKKHYAQYRVSQETNSNVTSSTLSASTAVMDSKTAGAYQAHAEEYRNISRDLIKVIIINGLFLAAIFVLYYINKTQPFLDSWYSKLF